jgi:hypothetical protein
MDVFMATDFFTTEVWTLGGLVTRNLQHFTSIEGLQVEKPYD